MKLGETELRAAHYVGALVSVAYILSGKDSLLLRSAFVAGGTGVYMSYEAPLAQIEGWKDRVKDYTRPLVAGAFLGSLPCALIGLAQLPFQDWVCGGASTVGVRLLYGLGCLSVTGWASYAGSNPTSDGYTTPPRQGEPLPPGTPISQGYLGTWEHYRRFPFSPNPSS